MGGIRAWWKRVGGVPRAVDTGLADTVIGGASEPADGSGTADPRERPGSPPTGERTAAQASFDQLLRQAANRRPTSDEEPPSP